MLRRDGRRAGIQQGKKEANLENAKKMIKRGIAIEVIKEITGMSKEEIEELKKKR